MFFDMCRVQGSKTDGNFEEFDFKAKLNGLQDWNVWYASSFPAPAYIDNKGKTQELNFGEQTDYGYFTKYIVNLLNQTDVLVIEEALKNNGKNGCIDTRELSEYIHDNVKKEVSAESSGKQIPTVSAISRSNNQFCIISNSNKISMEVESSTKQPITEAIKDIIEYGALRNDRNFYCDTEAINYIRFTFGNLGNELRNQGTASLSLLLDYKRQIFSAFAYLISSSTENLYEDRDIQKVKTHAKYAIEMALSANKVIDKCEKNSMNSQCKKLLDYIDTGRITARPWNYQNLAHAHALLADILAKQGDQLIASSHIKKMLKWFDRIESLPNGNKYKSKWFLDPEPYLFNVCSQQQFQQNNICNNIKVNFDKSRFQCDKK